MSDFPDLPAPPASADQPHPAELSALFELNMSAPSTAAPPMRRPAELDPAALQLALNSPDAQQLPTNLTPETLFSTPAMSHRRIRLGALLLGLEKAADSDTRDAE